MKNIIIVYTIFISTCAICSHQIIDPNICGTYVENKIFGGEKTEIDEFPWIVLLEYETVKHRIIPKGCHGALISSKYVLTAAHCIKLNGEHKQTKLTSVILGEYDTETKEDCVKTKYLICAPPAMKVPVEKTVVHKGFDLSDINRYNDIALIRLQSEVPFSEFIQPICITKEVPPHMYKTMHLAGWGKTESGEMSNIKLKVTLPLRNNSECNFNSTYHIGENQICAGKTAKDSCKGDSGAPLMNVKYNPETENVHWYAIGIVSFGPAKCGQEDKPGVYVKVEKYIDWITNNIEP